jgi:hypothetical protein
VFLTVGSSIGAEAPTARLRDAIVLVFGADSNIDHRRAVREVTHFDE